MDKQEKKKRLLNIEEELNKVNDNLTAVSSYVWDVDDTIKASVLGYAWGAIEELLEEIETIKKDGE